MARSISFWQLLSEEWQSTTAFLTTWLRMPFKSCTTSLAIEDARSRKRSTAGDRRRAARLGRRALSCPCRSRDVRRDSASLRSAESRAVDERGSTLVVADGAFVPFDFTKTWRKST